jgi:cytochrome c-type biogenesis protein CcmH
MTMLPRLLFMLCLLSCAKSWAVIETYEFSDDALESRYQQLSAELRCPKCQNQNIADSNAPIAQDLRKLLYQQLEEGASDDEILDHMVARYGEFVRYRPRFGGATAILWLSPVLLLLAGIVVLRLTLRSRPGAQGASSESLSAAEQVHLDELLQDSESKS